MSQTLPTRIVSYVKSHSASLGTLLSVYGAFYLFAVIRTGWTPSDWATQTPRLESLQPPVLNAYLIPAFFVTSLPALILGTAILCGYSIRVLRSSLTVNSEHVAILLTVFGFAYQVLGAWPLMGVVDFAWVWQKQILGFGSVFAWALYVLSVVALTVGVVSLFVHSRDYHRRHHDLSDV
jgi:hypothetical protein